MYYRRVQPAQAELAAANKRIAELERQLDHKNRVIACRNKDLAELEAKLTVAQDALDYLHGATPDVARRIAELEALAKLFAKPVIDKDGVLWIGDGVGYVPARAKEKDR